VVRGRKRKKKELARKENEGTRKVGKAKGKERGRLTKSEGIDKQPIRSYTSL
jgi:hypothetical protein